MQRGINGKLQAASGMSLDDVRVHYNSSKPQQLTAHAYAQGPCIHVAMGQSQHVAHEVGHVQGWQVLQHKPIRGVNINDNSGLEREADVMGNRGANG